MSAPTTKKTFTPTHERSSGNPLGIARAQQPGLQRDAALSSRSVPGRAEASGEHNTTSAPRLHQPRRQRSRSLQHVPSLPRATLTSERSVPALAPPRPKSPAPELKRASAPAISRAPGGQRQERMSPTPAARANSTGARQHPGATAAPTSRTLSPLGSGRSAATREMGSVAVLERLASKANFRIKRRSTPPELRYATPQDQPVRGARSRSNPGSQVKMLEGPPDRGAARSARSLSWSSDSSSDIESDTSSGSSSSSRDEHEPGQPLLLSAFGEFKRYLQQAQATAEIGPTHKTTTASIRAPLTARDRETLAMLAEPAPKKILHTVGMEQSFIQLERVKHTDARSGKVDFVHARPDFYSTEHLNADQFEEFYRVHVGLRQYLIEQVEGSTLTKDFGKQMGCLFARVKGLTLAPQALRSATPTPLPELVLGAGSPDLLQYSNHIIDAIHGARSRGSAAPPNWARSRIFPSTLFSLIKRVDIAYTTLLLEDRDLGYAAVIRYRQHLLSYLLFDCTIMFVIQRNKNPFPAQTEDFHLYAGLQRALSEHIQFELANGSEEFFMGLINNTNMLGLGRAQKALLTERAEASQASVVPTRRGSSPRTNFIARSRPVDGAPSLRQHHNAAWDAAFLAWIESHRFPPSMQEGFRKVLEDNRNNPDVKSIQMACVVPIHDYAHNKKARDAGVDHHLIRLIRKLRMETFEFHAISLEDEE